MLFRSVLALCWAIEETGRDKAAETARSLFGEDGLTAATQALADLGAAATGRAAVPVPAGVPEVLKAEIDDLASSIKANTAG